MRGVKRVGTVIVGQQRICFTLIAGQRVCNIDMNNLRHVVSRVDRYGAGYTGYPRSVGYRPRLEGRHQVEYVVKEV